MTDPSQLVADLVKAFGEVIPVVDEQIGENRDYGAGIGPHDEDDQIAALVEHVQDRHDLDATIATAATDSSAVAYPSGRAADIVLRADDATVYIEAKLFRFQKANGNPSKQGYAKVFSPFQVRAGQSFIHDVIKLAESDVRAHRAFLGLYYRPVTGAGTEITSREIAEKFTADVDRWTEYTIEINAIETFSGLTHDVHARGGILSWELETQPAQFFD